MSHIRLALSSTILLLTGSIASAQIVQKNGGYLFNLKYQKGQVLKQNMGMQAVGNTKLKSSSQFIIRCLGVDKNNIASLEVTVPGVGKGEGSRKLIRVDRHGKPQGKNIEGYGGNFVWPDSPVKVGQSWLGDMNMAAPGKGGIGFKSTYKLTGVKKINGIKVAAISAAIDVKGTYDVSGTGMIYVRFSDGQLQSADFNLMLNQFSESNSQAKLKLLMTIRTMP